MPKTKRSSTKKSLKTKRSFLIPNFLSKQVILIIGVLLFISSFLIAPHNINQKSSSNIDQQWPQRLIIPSLKIDAPVIEGGIVNGQWILSDNSLHYLSSSGKIKEGFNTIIYGHKREGLLLNLINIQNGDLITVQTPGQTATTYQVFSKETVPANQIEKLQSKLPNTLTLFTCDGIFDQDRVVVKAKII